MTDATDRAKELLAAATDGPWPYDCLTLEHIRRWMRRSGAQRPEADTRLASLAPDTMRVAILMAEAAQLARAFIQIEVGGYDIEAEEATGISKALLAWEKLFP